MLNKEKSRFSSGKTIFLITLLCILSVQISNAQWQPDTRLTNDPAISLTSFGNTRCVAASGNFVHVVFYDTRDNNSTYEIYYKRSTDGGLSFGADIRLTDDTAQSYNPGIALSGSVVHVIWYDRRDGNSEIYYKRSTDGGITWGPDIRLTNNSASSSAVSIAASGLNVHLVWHDYRDGNWEIYYKQSTDGGDTWSEDMRLTNNTGSSLVPAVTVYGSVVHVTWQDSTAGNWEIYYKRSTDGGITWGADVRLTNDPAFSGYPSIGLSGSTVHIAWIDNRNGTDNIYYKRSTNGGLSWASDFRLTKNYSNLYPSLAVNGSVVHIVFQRFLTTGWDIFYNISTNGGARWGNDAQLTNNPSASQVPSIAVSASSVHIIFRDDRDGNSEIYYKQKLNAPAGSPIGISNINSVTPNMYSLSLNYPNPFNPTTKIKFALPNNSFAKLVVFDALGREMETLVNEQLNSGIYEVDWKASNYPSGVYFYTITAGGFTQTYKMILLK